MAKLIRLAAAVTIFILGLSLSFATNSDIIYFFPLNSTTISGVVKNGFCTDTTSTSIKGSTSNTTVGPSSSQNAVNLAPDNYINLGDFSGTCISDPGLCTTGMTVAFWVRLDPSGSGDRHVINTGRMDTSRGIQVFYVNSHTNVVLCDGTKRYPAEIEFPGYWTLVVAVYNPSGSTAADKFYVYVNGTQKETARYETSCTLADTETSLLIGHDNTSALSGGRSVALSQLTFFFRSLNQTEAQQIYSNPSSGIQLNCPDPPTTAATTTAPPTTTGASTTGASTTGAATDASTTGASTTGAATDASTTGASTTGAATDASTTGASTTGAVTGASTTGAAVATTSGADSNTSTTPETTSTGPNGATTSAEPSGSSSGQGQENDGKSRPPTVLILLSFSLFFILIIVIIIIIGCCCILLPRAKEKGYISL